MTTRILLYLAHAIDHLALLIFAAAVSAIARDFGMARWEDLMPYATGAFVMFGIASLPAGHLGDLWGRRAMMLIFYFGMGLSLLWSAATTGPWPSSDRAPSSASSPCSTAGPAPPPRSPQPTSPSWS